MGYMQERPDAYYIPDNLNDGRALFHIPNRNLIETAAMEAVLFGIFRIAPLGMAAKIIAGIIVMGLAGLLGIVGIKNESLTEFIISSIRFRKKRRNMHYRRCDQVDRTVEEKKQKTESRTIPGDKAFRKLEDTIVSKIEEEQRNRGRRQAGIIAPNIPETAQSGKNKPSKTGTAEDR